MHNFSAKEKYLVTNTLNCVPVMLIGHAVLIDLRNETSVAGIIDNTDGHMNVELSQVVFIDRNQQMYTFDNFMVRNRMIRFIHIPSYMDIEKELVQTMERGILRRNLPKKDNPKRTFKQKRAQERHKETLAHILSQKQKEAAKE